MNILICMASVDPKRGGPSTAVRSMASALAEQGHKVTIIAHDDRSPAADEDRSLDYELLTFPLTTRLWQFSLKYVLWAKKNLGRYDAVLIHSLFLSHSFFLGALARKCGVPYSIRPHGSLNIADMTKNNLQKIMYMWMIEKNNLKNASFLFCTSQREATEAVRFGNFRTEVIPLGVDSTITRDRDAMSIERDLIVFIGRLTSKKGIEIIIRGLPQILKNHPSAQVVIGGPDDEGLKSGFEKLAIECGVAKAISYPGHLDHDARNRLLERAGVFVLPSRDENFGIGVAEAMAAGVPVVITEGVSHAGYVLEYGAGTLSSRDPEDFARRVSEVLSLDAESFSLMSASAQRLVQEKYSWRRSARQLVEAFTLPS